MTYSQLGKCFLDQGDLNQAERCLNNASEHYIKLGNEPAEAAVLRLLATVYVTRQDLVSARRCLERVVSLDQRYTAARASNRLGPPRNAETFRLASHSFLPLRTASPSVQFSFTFQSRIDIFLDRSQSSATVGASPCCFKFHHQIADRILTWIVECISCSGPNIGSRSLMTLPRARRRRSPTITVGTQEVGLTAGYLLPHRLTGTTRPSSKARPSCPPG